MLFVDGHKTHLTYQLSNLYTELQIVLIALYPNSEHILQPADVAAFRPLKTRWKNAVLMWHRENLNTAVRKEDFAPILKELLDSLDLTPTIINGFKATGLFLSNPATIDYSKCLGKDTSTVVEDSKTIRSV